MTQDKLLEVSRTGERLADCIKLLEESGYTVSKLKGSSKKVTNKKIVERFYFRLRETCGDTFSVVSRINESGDLKAVIRFQEKAKKEGMSKDLANETLYELVELVFNHYESLKLKTPPATLNYLISPSGFWILSRALAAHKAAIESYEDSDEAYRYKLQKYNDMDEDENFKRLRDKRHEEILKGGNDSGETEETD
jgi:hypothetical protein